MSGPLTEEELAAIEAREKMATPGPWYASTQSHDDRPRTQEVCDLANDMWVVTDGRLAHYRADAAFIAAARSDVPRLLSEVRRLRQKIADMEAANREQIRRADEIAGVPS